MSFKDQAKRVEWLEWKWELWNKEGWFWEDETHDNALICCRCDSLMEVSEGGREWIPTQLKRNINRFQSNMYIGVIGVGSYLMF